jgi:N-acetylglucosaminyldiphosphoundecaprenol N-acetyl-beta-D-mannosaminyltransferase
MVVCRLPAAVARMLGEVQANGRRAGRVTVLGCPLDAVTMGQAVNRVERAIVAGRTYQHVSVNAAKLVKYQSDPVLREVIVTCDLVTADGQAVVWAARLLGQTLPERVTGIDLMGELLDLAARRGYGVYLLGARQPVLERTEAAIKERFPGLRIVGRHHGYFALADEEAIVEEIRDRRPELLFVARETPAKELFLARHEHRLGVPFVMGVGGAFDVIAGVRRRAPARLRRLGLEWLYRLLQEPRRLAGRYILGNSHFIWLVARELARGSSRRHEPA